LPGPCPGLAPRCPLGKGHLIQNPQLGHYKGEFWPTSEEYLRGWQGGFKSRAEATRALRMVLSLIDDGSYIPPRPDTVGAYLRDWLEAQRPHVAPTPG
jgi:hypothetical protein